MQLKPGNFCPLLQKDCVQMQCSWFVHIRGTNPQTGQEVDEWGCSMTWLPLLLIENAQQTRQTGAATESMRNEIIKRMDNTRPIVIEPPSEQTQCLLQP